MGFQTVDLSPAALPVPTAARSPSPSASATALAATYMRMTHSSSLQDHGWAPPPPIAVGDGRRAVRVGSPRRAEHASRSGEVSSYGSIHPGRIASGPQAGLPSRHSHHK